MPRVSNGYIAGLTLVIPFSSILTRRVGPKRVILLSLLLFSAASVAAGLSSSLESLIASASRTGRRRGFTDPGWSGADRQQFKPHERARLSSAVMLVALLAPACSPAVGGMLVQTFSWRWIFFATLPVVIVTFALACAWLKTEPSPITPTEDSKPVFADGSAVALIHAYLCVRTRHFLSA
ncbi:MFS transporter [Enterobacter hormaechei]|uniref:MFS transporter n=1 Tax=Enterobacter hormaechei TaxID=158836 RepID=A0A927DL77_9ENTR|nr:MFS transporter [Enterobacter hormaechei]MBD3707287.1 MFS transporter [Enterobacter hormaechei]MBD3716743.1 MFS transporter [Enterobacter hormaechei]